MKVDLTGTFARRRPQKCQMRLAAPGIGVLFGVTLTHAFDLPDNVERAVVPNKGREAFDGIAIFGFDGFEVTGGAEARVAVARYIGRRRRPRRAVRKNRAGNELGRGGGHDLFFF